MFYEICDAFIRGLQNEQKKKIKERKIIQDCNSVHLSL